MFLFWLIISIIYPYYVHLLTVYQYPEHTHTYIYIIFPFYILINSIYIPIFMFPWYIPANSGVPIHIKKSRQEVLHHRWLDHIVLLAQPQVGCRMTDAICRAGQTRFFGKSDPWNPTIGGHIYIYVCICICMYIYIYMYMYIYICMYVCMYMYMYMYMYIYIYMYTYIYIYMTG